MLLGKKIFHNKKVLNKLSIPFHSVLNQIAWFIAKEIFTNFLETFAKKRKKSIAKASVLKACLLSHYQEALLF